MLVLERKMSERIVLPQVGVIIEVVEIKAGKVVIGITAEKSVRVYRSEVWSRICDEHCHLPPSAA